MNLSTVASAWSLGKSVPLIVVSFALGYFMRSGCEKMPARTGGVDSTLTLKVDQLFTLLGEKPAPVVVREVRTVVVDAEHDCWNSLYTLIGRDTLSIDSLNSCKGVYKGIRLAKTLDTVFVQRIDTLRQIVDSLIQIIPEDKDRAFMGYEFEGLFGASLPGNTFLGLTGRAWLGRFGIFATPRLAVPHFDHSSFDAGISYKF